MQSITKPVLFSINSFVFSMNIHADPSDVVCQSMKTHSHIFLQVINGIYYEACSDQRSKIDEEGRHGAVELEPTMRTQEPGHCLFTQ